MRDGGRRTARAKVIIPPLLVLALVGGVAAGVYFLVAGRGGNGRRGAWTFTSAVSPLTFRYTAELKELSESEQEAARFGAVQLRELTERFPSLPGQYTEGVFAAGRGGDHKYLLVVGGIQRNKPYSEGFMDRLIRSASENQRQRKDNIEPRAEIVGGEKALVKGADSEGMLLRTLTVVHGKHLYDFTLVALDSRDEALEAFELVVDSVRFRDRPE